MQCSDRVFPVDILREIIRRGVGLRTLLSMVLDSFTELLGLNLCMTFVLMTRNCRILIR